MDLTYKRKSAVSAGGNLRLVRVDEDLGVTQRTTTSVTIDNSVLGPTNGLSVDELDSGIGLRLIHNQLMYFDHTFTLMQQSQM